MSEDEAHHLITSGIHTLIEHSEIKNFYLYTGSRGMVPLLDSAHRIRQEFASENLELIVYH